MSRIFISYRRLDSKWAVGRIYDRLSQVLKRESLFLDVNDIEPGEDYVDRIRRIVGICDVLLVVIGRDWLTARDNSGRRRLDDPNDWVRVEIATALERGIRVIPLLLDDAAMPEGHELPDDLAPLSRRNAKLISFGQFHSDLDSLLRILEKVLESSDSFAAQKAASNARTERSIEKGGNDTVATPTPASSSTKELPLTISVKTEGDVATPLINRGELLPAKNKAVFSTATNNQTEVTIELFWGESEKVAENQSLGSFSVDGIAPARSGVPKIEISTEVNEELTLTVMAKDLGTGSSQVLDVIDLTSIRILDSVLADPKTKPRKTESKQDVFDIYEAFEEFLADSDRIEKQPTKK